MKKINENIKIYFFPISIIFILAFSRLIPHPPNFTPIIAAAVISPYLFKNIYLSLGILLSSMFLSDLIIGLYSNFIFIYLSLFLVIIIQSKIVKKITFKNLFIYSINASVIFFVTSNFSVWMFSNLYEKSFNGLIYCYILAIPFFINTVLSTIFFSYLAYVIANFGYKKIYN